MVQAFQILRGTCTYCHRFLVNDVQVSPFRNASPKIVSFAQHFSFFLSRLQLLKQIARLTLLEHGHVVAALAVDQVFVPPASSKSKSGKKGASASQNIEDAEQGESTDETVEEFKRRLESFVESAIKGGKKLNGDMDRGRDEYKESGTVFDVRKRVIAEFLKSLSGKKRCEHCGA